MAKISRLWWSRKGFEEAGDRIEGQGGSGKSKGKIEQNKRMKQAVLWRSRACAEKKEENKSLGGDM